MTTRFEAPERLSVLKFGVTKVREITSPEGKSRGRKTYAGCAPYASFLEVPNVMNVRDNLLSDPGKKRIKPSAVYRDMLESLQNDPLDFEAKHGGFVIVATKAELHEDEGYIVLHGPSIINGAQSQGVLADWKALFDESGTVPPQIHPRFEIVVTNSSDLGNEISIARNNQNAVKAISIAGARHQLDELQRAVKSAHPDWDLRMDESNTSDKLIDTEKLLQVATALMPSHLCEPGASAGDAPKKVYSYSMRAKCLREFVESWEAAHLPIAPDAPEKEKERHRRLVGRYDYYVGIAPVAWEIYQTWSHHPGWSGLNLRQGVERTNNKVTEVADGFVFPVLAALAVFVEKKDGAWKLAYPPVFDDKMLIQQVKMALGNRSIGGNPWNLGKSADAWAQIHAVAWTFKEMATRLTEQYDLRSMA